MLDNVAYANEYVILLEWNLFVVIAACFILVR